MSEGHSTYSCEKATLLGEIPTRGIHKVRYQPNSDWDFHLEGTHVPIDLSLNMPHYRARCQPVDHRMSMFVGSESESIKLRVCRTFPRSKFYLEIQADSSDVTIWLPSDFRGRIHHSGKPSFSAGFVNRILRNVRVNESRCQEIFSEDEVMVMTQGQITFRMWDVQSASPENTPKESFKRMFGCSRKVPETVIDWDCLLRD